MTERLTSTAAPPLEAEWLVNQIAHTLRNPIFAAMVQTEALVFRAGEAEGIANAARLVHRQLKRLEADINEMLLYGRPPRLQPRRLDLARLIARIAETFIMGEHGEPAEVEAVVPDHPVEVNIDPDAVRVVVDRLVMNAVQHTQPPHAVRLELAVDPSGLVVAVHDQGAGIPDEIRDKVFLPFYPQHSGRPGLGLAVAAKFAHALGGRLIIESEVGVGTVARCVLPPPPAAPA